MLPGGQFSVVFPDAASHGYGTRSIQYIARLYGGDMSIESSGTMFFLNVWFPLAQDLRRRQDVAPG